MKKVVDFDALNKLLSWHPTHAQALWDDRRGYSHDRVVGDRRINYMDKATILLSQMDDGAPMHEWIQGEFGWLARHDRRAKKFLRQIADFGRGKFEYEKLQSMAIDLWDEASLLIGEQREPEGSIRRIGSWICWALTADERATTAWLLANAMAESAHLELAFRNIISKKPFYRTKVWRDMRRSQLQKISDQLKKSSNRA
jgi:hypothetical protein